MSVGVAGCEYAGAFVPTASPARPKKQRLRQRKGPFREKAQTTVAAASSAKRRRPLRTIHISCGNRPVGSPSALLWERNLNHALKEARIMTKQYDICLLPGDGIGPGDHRGGREGSRRRWREVRHVLRSARSRLSAAPPSTRWANPAAGTPRSTPLRPPMPCCLPAVGGPKWDTTDPGAPRPEAGLLGIRKELGLYTNLRPVQIFDALAGASDAAVPRSSRASTS